MVSIQDRILQVIETNGVSINAAAKKTGIPQSKLFRIAKGVTKKVDIEALQSFAKAFNVSVEWLRTGKGEMETVHPQNLADKVIDSLARGVDIPRGGELLAELYEEMPVERQRDLLVMAATWLLAEKIKKEGK